MNAGRRHLQLAGDGPEAKPLGLEFPDLSGATIDGGRATKLNATSLGSGQPGVHALLDYAALEFGHSRVVSATEAARQRLHFVFGFEPTGALLQVRSGAGAHVSFDGTLTVDMGFNGAVRIKLPRNG